MKFRRLRAALQLIFAVWTAFPLAIDDRIQTPV